MDVGAGPSAAQILAAAQRAAVEAGRRVVVAAVILDEQGRAFTPRRTGTVTMLPGLWDLVGGHVEPGESLTEALAREVTEETGWTVRGDPSLAHVSDWEVTVAGEQRRFREFDFVVAVDGNLGSPRLAAGEHDDFRWVGPDDLGLFDENRGRDRGLIRKVVEVGLRYVPNDGPTFPHATLFLPPKLRELVDERRRTWDPAMALQVPPHLSVAKPHEVADLDALLSRTAAAADTIGPFELRLMSPRYAGDPADGIALTVADLAGGWHHLRSAITGASRDGMLEAAHVTLVHPRTSGLGASAWPELAGWRIPDPVVVVDEVCVTAFDGQVWQTVERFRLTG